jgi:methylenetetrahydrofolate reductase (NADPH)
MLLDGTKINGPFRIITGAVANPCMKPLELNMIRLMQKVESGADFIQTQAVFDTDGFNLWMEAARGSGVSDKTAILAGVLPLDSAEEAERLRDKYTEFQIHDSIIERLKSAGDMNAQKKEGASICAEIINTIKNVQGLRGIHIMSGGKEECIPDILKASGLAVKH